jgi:hypothetical protein
MKSQGYAGGGRSMRPNREAARTYSAPRKGGPVYRSLVRYHQGMPAPNSDERGHGWCPWCLVRMAPAAGKGRA